MKKLATLTALFLVSSTLMAAPQSPLPQNEEQRPIHEQAPRQLTQEQHHMHAQAPQEEARRPAPERQFKKAPKKLHKIAKSTPRKAQPPRPQIREEAPRPR